VSLDHKGAFAGLVRVNTIFKQTHIHFKNKQHLSYFERRATKHINLETASMHVLNKQTNHKLHCSEKHSSSEGDKQMDYHPKNISIRMDIQSSLSQSAGCPGTFCRQHAGNGMQNREINPPYAQVHITTFQHDYPSSFAGCVFSIIIHVGVSD